MRKILLTLFTILTNTVLAQNLIGYMTYRSTWSGDGDSYPKYGWYTFEVGSNNFVQHTSDFEKKACKGGTCAEGRLFAMEAVTDSWLFPDPRLHIYDAATYKELHSVSYGRADKDHATKDFSVNPADHQLYAIAQYRDGNTADGGWIQHYDLSNGDMTRIAHLPKNLQALAIDSDGNFFCLDEDGTLYNVTWDATKKKEFAEYGFYPEAKLNPIGSTGLRLQGDLTYANSLCFDYRTGHLYWAASVYPTSEIGGTDGIVRGLFEIDPATAATTVLQEFPDNIIITALAVPYLGIDHPDDIQDLSVRPQQLGSENIAMAFTAPAVTYGQTPYPEGTKFRVHPMLDGHDYYETLLEAGYIGDGPEFALSESDFTVAAGEVWYGGPFRLSTGAMHTLGAFVEELGNGAKSQTAERTIYVGFDTPCPPTDVQMQFNRERNTATLSWTAPTEGIHGGEIDTEKLTYIVSRIVNNATEEIDLNTTKDVTFTDVIDSPMSYMRYDITASDTHNVSTPARSAYAVLGQPRELPFMSTFSYIGEFHQFIVIDANGDGFDDWSTPSWYYDPTYGAAFCYLNREQEAQDDWLVTPALQLEAGEDYDVIFQSYGYYGNVPIRLQVAVGKMAEPESLSRVVYDKEYSIALPEQFPYETEDVLTDNARFTAEEGDLYIGFHNITTTFDHMSLDNIYIRKAKGSGVLNIEAQEAATVSFDLSGRRINSATIQGLRIENGKKQLK